MTKRKPLEWIEVGGGMWPACVECSDWLSGPLMAEAIVSTAIENGSSSSTLARRITDQYHANRHREAS